MNPTEESSSTNIPSTPPTTPPPAANPPPPSDASPRQGSGSGSSSNAPIRRPPPQMGIPGHSAFAAYTRPPPPPPPPAPPAYLFSFGPSRPTGSANFTGGFRVRGAQSALAVGAGGATAPGIQIGGNIPARKRGRDSGAGGNPAAAEVDHNQVSCSICGKDFNSPKALFGHMRSHPGRGWRGARPPPTFSAEEEFADIRAATAAAAAATAGEEGRVGAAVEEEGRNFKLPDLNNPPPEDDST